VIVYIGGGGMAGVYGAGVLKGINDLGLGKMIETIYAGSAGALDAAYFLSGQHDLGSSIYWEDLCDNFIFPLHVFLGTYDLFINRFVRPLKDTEVRSVINIDYLLSIMSNIKPLNLETLATNKINLFVKLLNLRSGEVVYVRAQDKCLMELFHAAINIKPFYFPDTYFEGELFVDGTIKEPIGIQSIVTRHPNRKIIVIINEPQRRGTRHHLKNFLEGAVASLYPTPISLFRIFMAREGCLRRDLDYCFQDKNILVISPNHKYRVVPKTTNPQRLKNTFLNGIEDAKAVIPFIG